MYHFVIYTYCMETPIPNPFLVIVEGCKNNVKAKVVRDTNNVKITTR